MLFLGQPKNILQNEKTWTCVDVTGSSIVNSFDLSRIEF